MQIPNKRQPLSLSERLAAVAPEPKAKPQLRAVPLPGGAPPLPACPGTYIPAYSYGRPDFLVDRALRRHLRRHYLKLFSPRLRTRRPARVFFILGFPGEGKTESILVITSRAGIDIVMIAGADLAGELEGAPVATLKAAFDWIALNSQRTRRHCILLIDDIDASIVPEPPGVQRTNNTEAAIGKLQSICNSPDLYTTADGTPIPMVWSGNSDQHFRPSLLRPGRTTRYRHAPDLDTKALVIESLFQPVSCHDQSALRALVARYPDRPLAWWNDLRSAVLDATIDTLVDADGPLDTQLDDRFDLDRFDLAALTAAAERHAVTHSGNFNQERV